MRVSYFLAVISWIETYHWMLVFVYYACIMHPACTDALGLRGRTLPTLLMHAKHTLSTIKGPKVAVSPNGWMRSETRKYQKSFVEG